MAQANKKAKANAGQWACTEPTGRLAVITAVARPLDKLIRTVLFRSGSEWDTSNNAMALAGRARQYRLLDAHYSISEAVCALDLLRLAVDSELWHLLPPGHRTLRNRTLAFCMLSRAASGCYIMLRLPNRGFPLAIFNLIGPSPPTGQAVQGMRRCYRDDFSEKYLTDFHDRADCSEGKALLRSIAELSSVDTVEIEVGHSKWQSEARAKGLMTIGGNTQQISAVFLCQRQRQDERVQGPVLVARLGRRPKPKQASGKRRGRKPADNGEGGKVKKVRVRKRKWQRGCLRAEDPLRNGGGGAYRAFLNKYLTGMPGFFNRITKELNDKYRCIKSENGTEFQDLERIGQAATTARALTKHGSAFASSSPAAAGQARSMGGAVDALVPYGCSSFASHPSELNSVLAVADGVWANVELRKLRSTLSAASRRCKEASRNLTLALAHWFGETSGSISELVSPGVVGGGRQPPGDFDSAFHHFKWCPPAMRLSEYVLKAAGDPQHVWVGDEQGPQNMHAKLRSAWSARHAVIQHKACRSLGNVMPTKQYASECRFLGWCVCCEEHRDLANFRRSFVAMLQVLMKKDKRNPFKAVFEAARGVLRLDFFAPDDDVDHDVPQSTRWCTVPHANQASWCVGLIEAYPDSDVENVRIARSIGHVALRTAVGDVPSSDEVCNNNPDAVFEAWGMDNCPRLFRDVDFELKCQCSVYQIVELDRELVEFVPACIEVVACERPPFLLWPLPVTDVGIASGPSSGSGTGKAAQRAGLPDRGRPAGRSRRPLQIL
jgi:hypothetical protein